MIAFIYLKLKGFRYREGPPIKFLNKARKGHCCLISLGISQRKGWKGAALEKTFDLLGFCVLVLGSKRLPG